MRKIGAVALIAAVVALMLLIKPAAAKVYPPTNNQLFAGYCVGVKKALEASVTQKAAEPSPAFLPLGDAQFIQQEFQRRIQELERDRQRFLGYLLSNDSMDWTGVLFAVRNGEVDVQDGLKDGNRCLYPFPTNEESQKHGVKWMKAYIAKNQIKFNKCIESIPARQRFIRCDQPN